MIAKNKKREQKNCIKQSCEGRKMPGKMDKVYLISLAYLSLASPLRIIIKYSSEIEL
jgi:hypothetical protein